MSIKKDFDYYEGDPGDEQEKVELSAFELAEMIEQRIESKGTKGWKKETNSLIDEYNRRFKHVYKRL